MGERLRAGCDNAVADLATASGLSEYVIPEVFSEPQRGSRSGNRIHPRIVDGQSGKLSKLFVSVLVEGAARHLGCRLSLVETVRRMHTLHT